MMMKHAPLDDYGFCTPFNVLGRAKVGEVCASCPNAGNCPILSAYDNGRRAGAASKQVETPEQKGPFWASEAAKYGERETMGDCVPDNVRDHFSSPNILFDDVCATLDKAGK